jgi:hypothetical protein
LRIEGKKPPAALALLAALLVAACGDRVPESEAAKKLGTAPKQTIDKAAAGVSEALQKGAEERAKQSR